MKKHLIIYSILFMISFTFVKCKKESHLTPSSSSQTKKLKNDPPPVDTLIYDDETEFYLDGSPVEDLDDNHVKYIMTHQTLGKVVYGFTNDSLLLLWLNAQATTIKNVLTEAYNESKDLEADSTLDPPSSIFKSPKYGGLQCRVAPGGTTLFENLDGGGAFHYGAFWDRDLGGFRNRATSLELYGTGVTVFCMNKKFKGKKHFVGSVGYVRFPDLRPANVNDDIESFF